MDNLKTNEAARFFRWGAWAMMLLAIFLGTQTIAVLKGISTPDQAMNSISVAGEGEVIAVPDLATFSFAVSADAATVDAAQAQVTEKVDTVIEALKDLGIEEKDIKTENYSVWPKYRYETAASSAIYPPVPGRQVPDGYTASHSVTVKVRDTSLAGEALGAAGDRGATNISGISFTTDDPDALFEEARSLAITEAREKAERLADELGVRLVRIVGFYDNSGSPYPVPYGMGAGDAVMMKAESAASAPSIPQGENKIRVNVNITYEVR